VILRHPNRAVATVAVFQQQEVPYERVCRSKRLLRVCGAEVRGVSQPFFYTIVVVVAERWPNLRFQLHSNPKLPICDYQQIPILRRAIEARDYVTTLAEIDVLAVYALFKQQIAEKVSETV